MPGASADVVRTRADADALQRPPLVILETLEAYLDEQGIGSGPADVIALPGGHSNATFLLRRQGCEAVLRRPPRPPIPPGANDVVREARVMAALEGTAVPVPRDQGDLRGRRADRRAVRDHGAGPGARAGERAAGGARSARPAPHDRRGVHRHPGGGARRGSRRHGARRPGQAHRLPRAPAAALRRLLGGEPHARAAGDGRAGADARRARARVRARPRLCTATLVWATRSSPRARPRE